MSRWIAAALVGNEGDEAAVEWAATEAAPGDEIRIVCPVPAHASAVTSWPVADEDDIAHVHARQRIDDAIDAVRRIRPPVVVSGSIVFGPSSVILGETVQSVDLLVLADDPWLTHPVVRAAVCPVVVLPPSADAFDIASAPIALLVDGSSLPTDAVQFAFEIAARRGTSLVVANTDDANGSL
ncbi:MAG: hypothetical protein QOG80_269, partial [Pseudonocardiales bacterium]|nr:hypothetical protein [Pseudonocardiales bacterium]